MIAQVQLPCYYSNATKELIGSQKSKALRFIKEDCIKTIGRDQWLVKKIKGYNKRDYNVNNFSDEWTCDCQYNVMTKKTCSHIMAVIMFMRGLR